MEKREREKESEREKVDKETYIYIYIYKGRRDRYIKRAREKERERERLLINQLSPSFLVCSKYHKKKKINLVKPSPPYFLSSPWRPQRWIFSSGNKKVRNCCQFWWGWMVSYWQYPDFHPKMLKEEKVSRSLIKTIATSLYERKCYSPVYSKSFR